MPTGATHTYQQAQTCTHKHPFRLYLPSALLGAALIFLHVLQILTSLHTYFSVSRVRHAASQLSLKQEILFCVQECNDTNEDSTVVAPALDEIEGAERGREQNSSFPWIITSLLVWSISFSLGACTIAGNYGRRSL